MRRPVKPGNCCQTNISTRLPIQKFNQWISWYKCTLLNCHNCFILLLASPLKKTLLFLDRLQYKWIFEFSADKNRSFDSEYVETLSKRQSPTKVLHSTLVNHMIIFTQDYSILMSLQAITTKYYPQVASFLAWFVASLLVFPVTRLKLPLWTADKLNVVSVSP